MGLTKAQDCVAAEVIHMIAVQLGFSPSVQAGMGVEMCTEACREFLLG
jgi:hypothetical protein